MNKRIGPISFFPVLVLSLLLSAGCAKKPAETVVPPAPQAEVTPPPTGAPEGTVEPGDDRGGIREERIADVPVPEQTSPDAPAAAAGAAIPELQRIFFDFDQYTLTPEAQQTLNGNADFLTAKPEIKVLIEGHCDERGSDEYNLSLGERRARAVQEYLSSLGIAPERLSTISYGEERPLEPSSNEDAWAKNRRAEFKIR